MLPSWHCSTPRQTRTEPTASDRNSAEYPAVSACQYCRSRVDGPCIAIGRCHDHSARNWCCVNSRSWHDRSVTRSQLIRDWERDLRGLSDAQLGDRLVLADDFERSSMRKGMGRNPKAAREWRERRRQVEAESWSPDAAATCRPSSASRQITGVTAARRSASGRRSSFVVGRVPQARRVSGCRCQPCPGRRVAARRAVRGQPSAHRARPAPGCRRASPRGRQ